METSDESRIALVDAWHLPEAAAFFRRVWPMYVHEISGFDCDFYALDESGCWQPDIVEDWVSSVTPEQSLRTPRARHDPAQPFQRAHVITCEGRPVGFICIGMQPFKYMAEDAELTVAEFFLIHAHRGTATAARAVELVLRRYPGRWELSVIHDNARAMHFWRKALPAMQVVTELEERPEHRDVSFRFVAAA